MKEQVIYIKYRIIYDYIIGIQQEIKGGNEKEHKRTAAQSIKESILKITKASKKILEIR